MTRPRRQSRAELVALGAAIETGVMRLHEAAESAGLPANTVRRRLVAAGLYWPRTPIGRLRYIAQRLRAGERIEALCGDVPPAIMRARLRAAGLDSTNGRK